jgi:tetratricopeptide (TPR) repeat protein
MTVRFLADWTGPASLNVNWRTRMKSDHRHELKTNELADWLMHFPDWAEQNRTTLIAAGVLVVVVLGVYIVRLYQGDSAAVRNQMRLTTLITRLDEEKRVAIQASPDKFLGFAAIAAELKDFADHAGNNRMAALALIKRGEALRAELHYGPTQLTADDVAKQVDQAKQSYTQALQLASSAPDLAATAKFGLGLCEEELGNFSQAKEMYLAVAKEPTYEGTAARAAAANRAKAMEDYKSAVVFKPAPPPKPVGATAPKIEIRPNDANAPVATSSPNNVTVRPTAPKTTPESNSISRPSPATPAATRPAQPAEANRPAGTAEPNRTGATR